MVKAFLQVLFYRFFEFSSDLLYLHLMAEILSPETRGLLFWHQNLQNRRQRSQDQPKSTTALNFK